MTDDKATDGQKSGNAPDDAADKDTSGNRPDTPTDDKGGKKSFTQDDVDRIVTKRLEKAKAAWEKDKDLTELERLKSENDTLKKQVASHTAFSEFETVATKHGVKNARGLFRALASEIEFSEAGKIKDVDALMEQAKDDLPEFFATSNLGDADGGKGDSENKKSKATDMNSIIRRGFGQRA